MYANEEIPCCARQIDASQINCVGRATQLATFINHGSPKNTCVMSYHGLHASLRSIDEIPLDLSRMSAELGLKW